MKKILYAIVIFLIFLLLLMVRTYWDSYRFYQSGIAKEQINKLESTRYYESSVKAYPVISHYADKSKDKIKR